MLWVHVHLGWRGGVLDPSSHKSLRPNTWLQNWKFNCASSNTDNVVVFFFSNILLQDPFFFFSFKSLMGSADRRKSLLLRKTEWVISMLIRDCRTRALLWSRYQVVPSLNESVEQSRSFLSMTFSDHWRWCCRPYLSSIPKHNLTFTSPNLVRRKGDWKISDYL